jgi:hypothetical protein
MQEVRETPPISKITRATWDGGMVQVIEYLLIIIIIVVVVLDGSTLEYLQTFLQCIKYF